MSTDLGVQGVKWDLADLYPAPDDPGLRQDSARALERAKAFAARYRGTIDVADGPAAKWVAGAVAELEAIFEQADKPEIYAHLLHAADVRPPEHGALLAETMERQSAVRTELLFFELEWVRVAANHAERILA